jgi:hypothetical protein
MTKRTARKFFVNLPVRDLQRSIAFFTELGFTFDPQFGDSCMILGEDAHVMLCPESRFNDFTRKQLCDTRTHTEALFCISAGSRAEVDELVHKALAAGGTTADEPQDHGFMYDWSFHDLDGHGWGVFWTDPAHVPA